MSKRAKKFSSALVVVVSMCVLTGYVLWPRTPLDLAAADKTSLRSLYASWDKGNVVLLIRHGERCDRSDHPCLGSQEGITLYGQSVAMAVGKSLAVLGLGSSDVISSPAIRTMQTALFMFGEPAVTSEWLSDCDQHVLDQVLTNKAYQRNLILVTHSGCISELEGQQGYAYADSSEYNSALFMALDAQGKPVIQGVLNPEGWQRFVQRN